MRYVFCFVLLFLSACNSPAQIAGPKGLQGITGATGSAIPSIASKTRCRYTETFFGTDTWVFTYSITHFIGGDVFVSCSTLISGSKTTDSEILRSTEPEAQDGKCELNIALDGSNIPVMDFTLVGVAYTSAGVLNGYTHVFGQSECQDL